MPALSIIVPVYNSEKYLSRCLDSIRSQTFSDYEIILIDDGSTDGCHQICDEYVNKDSRIKIIHKKNEGVSIARNVGLDLAKGDYITVVDSDDWLDSNMYQIMMNKAKEYNCDIVKCDCIKEYNDRSELISHNIRGGLYTDRQLRNEYYPHLLMMENVEYPATISNCSLIWRRTICNDNSIRYLQKVRYSEDLLFGSQIMSVAKSFFYIKGKALYHYRIHSDSVSNTFASDKWKDYKRIYSEAIRYFGDIREYDFNNQINTMVLFFLYNFFEDVRHSELRLQEKKELIQQLLNDEMVHNMFGNLNINKLSVSRKQKIKTFLLRNRIGIDCLLRIQ